MISQKIKILTILKKFLKEDIKVFDNSYYTLLHENKTVYIPSAIYNYTDILINSLLYKFRDTQKDKELKPSDKDTLNSMMVLYRITHHNSYEDMPEEFTILNKNDITQKIQ